ncbi:5-oxoprolinase subunit PxpB [Paenibacillus physcomitrellae]|uniref:Kinase A inhibitor n=1 Tax=Paenibacillus physcomitrellae TaxID=1619311 RepID=A0ABQ1FRL4_9BACL|nr:5-oxoprolinase subunit PxpB [Paenibacillus physcomitrellae]GGA26555.1 kinase A inhibitor [Paenibacillus physcomitrellae]
MVNHNPNGAGTWSGPQIHLLGDSGLVIKFGESIELETHKRIRQLSEYLEHHPFTGMTEYVPAFTTVTIYYDPWKVAAEPASADGEVRRPPFEIVKAAVLNLLLELKDTETAPPDTVRIPVCYGGDLGPDLQEVAATNGLTEEEVISFHCSGEYLVYMLGFAPGFAYLGGMSSRIATPRRQTPRLAIPAGTVGIAGEQTGVYPIETPGGWQLIGKTPIRLFVPERTPPTVLKAGDLVRFYPISRKEFDEWEESSL